MFALSFKHNSHLASAVILSKIHTFSGIKQDIPRFFSGTLVWEMKSMRMFSTGFKFSFRYADKVNKSIKIKMEGG
jgi:hypothetical protein